MKIEVISTGTELLRGCILNSNLAYIGRKCQEAGLAVWRSQTAGDDRESLLEALALAARRSDVLIFTGGLGSTDDDRMREVAGEFFGLGLERDEKYGSYLRYLWRMRHGTGRIPGVYFRQADILSGSEILANGNGTARGIYWQGSYGARKIKLFLLPGPPAEMEPMFEEGVLPKLAGEREEICQGFTVIGVGELEVQERVRKVLSGKDIDAAYCATPEGTRLYLSGCDAGKVRWAIELMRGELGPEITRTGEFDIKLEIVRLARERGKTLGLAESCTGGIISGALTEIPGVSEVFKGGIVSYANEVKRELLGVSEEILRSKGAVSAESAEAMARGAAERLGVDIAGSVTGIAGPDGGSDAKPTGTVYIAVYSEKNVEVSEHHFVGNRERVRERARGTLLVRLYKKLLECNP